MEGLDCARALAGPVGDLGARFMLAPETFARGSELGFEPGYAYYAIGRFGVLGDVHPDVVVAAAAFIEPGLVTATWNEARARVAPLDASVHYVGAAGAWADAHLAAFTGGAELADLAAAVIDAASVVNAPLVAGWRALERPVDDRQRAYLLLHLLRELRFARHSVAVQASGLSPIEAIIAGPGGEANAAMFGWPGPHPDPAPLAERRAEAEAVTDRLSAADLEVLDAGARARLVELVTAAVAAAT